MKTRVRRQGNLEEADWVVDISDDNDCAIDNRYIQPDGTASENLFRYMEEKDAQEAADLWTKRNNPAEAIRKFGHPAFYKLLDDMAELHSRKNHDYAGTSDPLKNLRACVRLDLEPFMGVMVRLQDKWSRLEEFVKSNELMVKNESVVDTLMDNAVYSLLAIILYQEQLAGKKD